MAEMNDIVKLAVDTYFGRVEKYSTQESFKTLHKALVAANNGKTELNYKDIRDGKCAGLFSLVEEILSRSIEEGLQGDEYFNSLVEYKNVPAGDKNIFLVEDNDAFVVSDAADGTQGIRRQRLGGVGEISIPTTFKVVKIFEDLSRVLANRVDLNRMITKVAEAFRRKMLDDIYTLWKGVTDTQIGGATYYPGFTSAGNYSENAMLDLVAHVEAAAGGKQATILGTAKALRHLAPSIQGEASKNDLYNLGYYGKFYGTPVVKLPQRHQVNSTGFVLEDDVLTVVATDEKPIKVVREGDPLVIMGNPLDKADLTQEYLYGEKYGTGIILAKGNSGIGRYKITG